MLDVAIIGAGLTGLSLAAQLQARGADYRLYEARDRVGGRILGHASASDLFRFDLGAGWIWPDFQPRLAELVERTGIATVPQWQRGTHLYCPEPALAPTAYTDPGSYTGSYRVHGGSWRLADCLLQQLPPNALHLGHKLLDVTDRGDHVALALAGHPGPVGITCRRVVLTLPPRLLAHSIRFVPELDAHFLRVMQATPTWMAGHAKALIRYAKPFWRQAGFSGNAFSRYSGAVLSEIFDACSPDGESAALAGFFGLPADARTHHRDDLETQLLDQLTRLFGPMAAEPEEIAIKDWAEDPLTATPADRTPPAGHPDYGHPWLQLDHWNDKLHFGGTETAREHGGYLEGALESAARLAGDLAL